MQTVSQRLALLRQRMALRGLDACVVVTDDFHGSEYVGDYFKTRAYLSGFTGSAGTLLVLAEEAYREDGGEALAETLAQNGCGVLITSARAADGGDAVIGRTADEAFVLPYERVPGHRWGTGDLFTGLLIDGLLLGRTAREAARMAGAGVERQLRGEEESLLPRP